MKFEIASPTRILFGAGTLGQLGTVSRFFGQKPLLVCGRSRSRHQRPLDLLAKDGFEVSVLQVDPEPTVAAAMEGVERARTAECDFVVGFGGGSAIDAGKAISALLANPGDPYDYLEVIGKGRALPHPALPFVAVPTTAGTGAEVTRNAVLGSPDHKVKVSLRSHLMLPKIALVDPEVTHSVPPGITASTGLDALTQVIEAYVSPKATIFTDALCREGVRRGARSLRRAWQNGDDAQAREDMALTSLFSGLALANAGLGAVHGLAGPLGGLIGAPHGAICAALLPHVMHANIKTLRRTDHASESLARYKELAELMIGNESASEEDGADWTGQLAQDLGIEGLADLGLSPSDIVQTAQQACRSSSMKANPVELTEEVLEEILYQAS